MILKQAVFLFLSLMTIVTAYDPDWALHPKIRDGPIRILYGITHLNSNEALYWDYSFICRFIKL